MNYTSKLVTIESIGKIHSLGGLNGPITTPTKIKIETIIELINSGKVVYEVNPTNLKDKIRLTRLNVYKNNFVKPEPVKVKHNAPKVVVKDSDVKHTTSNTEKLTSADTFVSNKKS